MAYVTQKSSESKSKIGFVTTWNQECGLATYARYLLSGLEPSRYTLFAEDTPRRRVRTDEGNVTRCWRRPSESEGPPRYDRLRDAILASDISILHINAHSGMFESSEFERMLVELKASGLRVIVHLHTLFTSDEKLTALIRPADAVIVHNEENKLEAIANGAKPASVFVLPHGVHCETSLWSQQSRIEARKDLKLPVDKALISTFGLIQTSKGIEGIIEALISLKSKGIPAHGVIIGRTNQDDPNSAQYYAALRQLAETQGISNELTFISEFVDEELLYRYLAASDIVMMNYRSQHYESSGATAIALGSGAVVATSIAPAFQTFRGAVWHMTAGYPPGLSAELLLKNSELREAVRAAGREYARQNSWEVISGTLETIYSQVLESTSEVKNNKQKYERGQVPENEKERVVMTSQGTSTGQPRRVLMQNRGNALSNPGGDTVVMNRLAEGLRARGHTVTVDIDGTMDPKNFDIVHLFNFALPQMVRTYGERAKAANVPFVVTSLYEDVPLFHIKSHACANVLMEYAANGQNRDWLNANWPTFQGLPHAEKFENEWALQNASAVFVNGESEARALRRDFPNVGKVIEVKLGHEVGALEGPDRFIREYGVKDFVFCVGRLETRKNQLMLVKALEDSDLTIVFAAGGFTYQPHYAEAVKNFKRRGKTIVLDRVSPEMLSSAYSACRVHVLPSWYELPGLVTLEALAHSKNVVASRNGTSCDYLGSHALYCDPADADSILNATLAGYYKPFDEASRQVALKFTWEATIKATEESYDAILGSKQKIVAPSFSLGALSGLALRPTLTGQYDSTSEVTELQDLVEKGELAAKSLEFAEAHRYLQQAESISPKNVRVLKARGAVHLAESNLPSAIEYFDRALVEAPSDPKVLSGRGMCEVMSSRIETAVPYFTKALQSDPTHLVAINQVVECAHRSKKYDEAIHCLKTYITKKPEDLNIKFCLAGCLLQAGQPNEAAAHLREIIRVDSSFKGASDMLDKCSIRPSVAAPPTLALSKDIQSIIDQIKGGLVSTNTTKLTEGLSGQATTNTPQSDKPIGNALADKMLLEAEEAKRTNNYEDVSRRSKDVQVLVGLSKGQICHAKALDAEVFVVAGKTAEAASIYDEILSIDPNYARALCGKGALAADAGDWFDAEQKFRMALASQPDFDVALAGLAVCAMQKNDADGAWDHFKRALKRNPENQRAILGIIQLGYSMKRYSEIEATLRDYLDLHPVNLEMQYSLAGVLYAQKKLDECESELSKILLFDPTNKRALELNAMLAKSAQDFAGAGVAG